MSARPQQRQARVWGLPLAQRRVLHSLLLPVQQERPGWRLALP
ncbi:hypothetical protein ACK31Z_01645 [Aeromonas dhakensis]|nr:hypothetical protein [Aeromonas dhakensis]MDH0173725.1 hypothetical protein [Aeromonas dhakensis]